MPAYQFPRACKSSGGFFVNRRSKMGTRYQLLFLCAAFGTTIPALAQQTSAPPVREARDEAQAYRAFKEREFEQNRQAFAALNRLPTLQAMVQLVQQQAPFRNIDVRGDTPAEQAVVRALLTETIAHYLTSVGLTPDDIRSIQRSGFDPVESAVRVIGGRGSALDRAVISEYAFIGEIVAVDQSTDKTVNSTIRVRPTTIIRSSPGRPLGNEVTIELRNPFNLIGTVAAAPGQSFLFFLSDTVGQFRAARGLERRASRGATYSMQLPPYRVEQDLLVPTGEQPIPQLPSLPLADFLTQTKALGADVTPAS